jgi:hypothetical protein
MALPIGNLPWRSARLISQENTMWQPWDFPADRLAVADKNLITASGLGSIEFACEIVKLLKIYTNEEIQELYGMFKHGGIPDRYAV